MAIAGTSYLTVKHLLPLVMLHGVRVKLGKDLGIFAADAILNDMTLLGVVQVVIFLVRAKYARWYRYRLYLSLHGEVKLLIRRLT